MLKLRDGRHYLPLALIGGLISGVIGASAQDTTSSPSVKVSGTVAKVKYCERKNEPNDFMIVTVNLKFTNAGVRKIILDKNVGNSPYDLRIAADEKSLAENRTQFMTNFEWTSNFIPGPVWIGGVPPSPGANFAVLVQNDSIELEREYRIPLHRDDNDSHNSDGISPGLHVLQLTLSTWPNIPQPKAEDYALRWAKWGDLVYKDLTTEPIPFSVPENPKLESCKPETNTH